MKSGRIHNFVPSESSLLKPNMPVMISTALLRPAMRYRVISRRTEYFISGFFVCAIPERSCTAKRVPISLSVERISVSVVRLMAYERTVQRPSYVIDNSVILLPPSDNSSCSTYLKR